MFTKILQKYLHAKYFNLKLFQDIFRLTSNVEAETGKGGGVAFEGGENFKGIFICEGGGDFSASH